MIMERCSGFARQTRFGVFLIVLDAGLVLQSCSKDIGSGEGWGGHTGATDERKLLDFREQFQSLVRKRYPKLRDKNESAT
jgi:hypothetical protein